MATSAIEKNSDHHEMKIEENEENMVRQDGSNDSTNQDKKPSRRPDIDLLRVSLTWGILLFHTTIAFIPENGWYIGSDYPPGILLESLAKMFRDSMVVWNMPMFFFLSGISTYFALFKKTEKQYRDERVHRLLIPYLLLFLFQFIYSITYFGPNCQQFFFKNETHEMEANAENASRLSGCLTGMADHNKTLGQYAREQHYSPVPGQGWFLLPLFLYSQMFAHLFCLWHPAHSSITASGLPCCGRPICCTRPFSRCVKIFSCITCFGKPASTPEELLNSTLWWLGSCIKLGLLPGLLLGLMNALILETGQPGLFYFAQPPILNLNYIFIMIFGYVITAADDHGIKEILHKGRWAYLSFGIFLNVICSVRSIPIIKALIPTVSSFTHLYLIIGGFISGLSEWLVILGFYGVARGLLTTSNPCLDHLSTLAMPFYLIHQQILVVILSGALWIPYLSSFPVVLILATLTTGLLAHLITKMNNARYFFGLKPATDSFLPGKKIRGFIPVIVLSFLVVLSFLFAFLL